MPRHSYREHDYTFGQTMLRLRKSLRLTQAGLAARLRVSRRAVGGSTLIGVSGACCDSPDAPYNIILLA